MPIASRTIQNSIDFCKRLSFNRNPVIGNSMDPALTAAMLVMQAILSPPFEWWWNSQELVLTCSPTPTLATSTNAVVAAGVLTVTATNTFSATNNVTIKGFTGSLSTLNGSIIGILTATGSGFTANVQVANSTDATAGVFTNITTQDYTIPVPSFSHIEHASVLDLSGPINGVYTPTKWQELTVKNQLALESSASRPAFISPHVEDGNGNMTFRLSSAPDKPYPVSIHVQLAAPALTNGVNSTWSPIPDFMQYVYDWGFLSLLWQFSDDPRAVYAENKFKAALLGRAEGLTEEQKNIFLNNWSALTSSQQMRQQQGIQAGTQ